VGLRDPMQIGERIELVHEPPGSSTRGSAWTQHKACRPTLNWPAAGIIADDDCLRQQAVGANAAPQRALGGKPHGILVAGQFERPPINSQWSGRAPWKLAGMAKVVEDWEASKDA
jgi:hypothetical protein